MMIWLRKDDLVVAMQTGDRINDHPENARAEILTIRPGGTCNDCTGWYSDQ
jgi:hypothetical protein